MKNLIKEEIESLHAVNKIMRKVREEKKRQKKAAKALRLNRQNSKYGLFIAFPTLLLYSCGALNKQKLTLKSATESQYETEENSSQHTGFQFAEWHSGWMQQADYSAAFIQADSTITFQPEKGFQLSKGSLFISLASNREAQLEESTFEKQEESSQSVQESSHQQLAENRIKNSEKQGFPIRLLFGIAFIAMAIMLLWAKYRKRKKGLNEPKF